ncbi:unnamed protein product [Ceutorhynchus assimilis]|uniref:Uncharacterized protein n=1 Tax=Ceutorhynchus assimilis TaxID=467358 RepID=A0A9N9N2U1_9CUCU|nr:unnamed protein product [Ceutorhynchus assimilis]
MGCSGGEEREEEKGWSSSNSCEKTVVYQRCRLPIQDPSTDNNTYPQFKAREATVLKKKPFIPSLPDKRVEREEFDRKMKLREAELEQQRQHIKEMQAEKEQKERAKCRKLALSKKVTDPVTPLLHQKKSGKGG